MRLPLNLCVIGTPTFECLLDEIEIFGILILSNIVPKLSSSCTAGCPYEICDFRIFCNPLSLISSQVFKNIHESDE